MKASEGARSNLITVLLDTNVFVAAYWARSSASARIIHACIRGDIRPHYSRAVRAEIEHILRLLKASPSYMESLESFWQCAIEVHPKPVDDIHIDDPDDRKFVEAAAGGETDFLVTNDEHLLKVGYVGRTEILTSGSAARVLGI